MPYLSLKTLRTWHAGATSALAVCGTQVFIEKLIDALCCLVPIESVMICLEQVGIAPTLLHEQGIPAGNRELLLNRYFTRGYLLDPFCLAVDRGLGEGFYTLSEIAPDNFFTSEYYKTYYLDAGSIEDCYFMLELDEQKRISISLYNGVSASAFTPNQLAVLRALSPLVLELCRQHWRTPPQPENGGASANRQLREAFMNFGDGVLTTRELEVCHLLLRGHSVKSTARVLDVSPETIRMHRKNLYSKLEVGSQAELFSLLIERLVSFGGCVKTPDHAMIRSKAH